MKCSESIVSIKQSDENKTVADLNDMDVQSSSKVDGEPSYWTFEETDVHSDVDLNAMEMVMDCDEENTPSGWCDETFGDVSNCPNATEIDQGEMVSDCIEDEEVRKSEIKASVARCSGSSESSAISSFENTDSVNSVEKGVDIGMDNESFKGSTVSVETTESEQARSGDEGVCVFRKLGSPMRSLAETKG